MPHILKNTFFLLLLSFLCACNDNSDTLNIHANISAHSNTWQANVFSPSNQYKNLCSNPRTGQDIQGRPYPDKAGSTLLENLWLRSWSNETYLWYNEIEDRNPSTYNNTPAYFATLKTNALSPSNTPKDQFHFYRDSAEYLRQVSGTTLLSYGMRLTFPNNQIYIAYTERNSPASNADIQRGDQIIAVNGINVTLALNETQAAAVNAALSPENSNTHRFTIKSAINGEQRTIELTPAQVTSAPVQNTKIIETDSGRIGYLTFNSFLVTTAEKALYDAFSFFKNENVNEVFLDLRYNGGGYLSIASQLAYMVAGNKSTGKTFERTVFNDKHPSINPVTGQAITDLPFIADGAINSSFFRTPLPSVNLNRVYILSSSDTCSASEAVINGLRGIDVEVVLIGTTTCGKPYGFYGTDNCGLTYFTIQFRGENNKGFGDYSDGFTPNNALNRTGELITGCEVDDDLNHALGNSNEGILSVALYHQRNGSCPSNTRSSTRTVRRASHDNLLLNNIRIKQRRLLENSRIYNLP